MSKRTKDHQNEMTGVDPAIIAQSVADLLNKLDKDLAVQVALSALHPDVNHFSNTVVVVSEEYQRRSLVAKLDENSDNVKEFEKIYDELCFYGYKF